jgi:hypothetical protein
MRLVGLRAFDRKELMRGEPEPLASGAASCQRNQRVKPMGKVDRAFLASFGNLAGADAACGTEVTDDDLNINQRLAQFFMLLQQLADSEGALESLSPLEFSELVSLALGMCGFSDPTQTREVIATVLEALERPDPGSEAVRFGPMPVPLN